MRTHDVFDTMITRRVGSPTDLFLYLADDLDRRRLLGASAAQFAVERERVEAQIREEAPGGEITIAQIYTELDRRGLLAGPTGECVVVELDMERRALVAIPGRADDLERVRREQGRAVFVSDTYLPSAWLQSVLDELGLWATSDRLYVSCEYGASKRTGMLFRVVADDLGIPVGEIRHEGDDLTTDVRGAELVGAAGSHRPEARLNRFERLASAHNTSTAGVASAMAGASRLARLHPPAGAAAPVVDIAASVAGPVLSSFVLWVLRRAIEERLERLYFVSRDGDVLLRMARTLAPLVDGAPTDLRYLHGGRRAWVLAAAGTDRFDPDRLIGHTRRVAPAALADLLGVSEDDLLRAARATGSAVERHELVPDPKDLVARLLTDGGFTEAVRRAAERRRDGVQAHLRQEGLLDDTRFGIVDLGWSGTMIGSLCSIVRTGGGCVDQALFFGLRGASSVLPRDVGVAFASDLRTGTGMSLGFDSLLEAMCVPAHGPVFGFADDAGIVRARLGPPPIEVERWGGATVRDVLDRYGHDLVSGMDAFGLEPTAGTVAGTVSLAHALLDEFRMRPTRLEAETWGRYPFDPSPAGDQLAEFAPARTLASVIVPRRSRARVEHVDSLWFEASRARMSRPARVAWRLKVVGSRLIRPIRTVVGRRTERS